MLGLPAPDALALISGESVIAFVERGFLTIGDERRIVVEGTRTPDEVKPAYRRWIGEPLPDGDWYGVTVAVHPAAILDPDGGSSRHILTMAPEGDLAIVRVFDGADPVLSDVAFAARRLSVEGALTA